MALKLRNTESNREVIFKEYLFSNSAYGNTIWRLVWKRDELMVTWSAFD